MPLATSLKKSSPLATIRRRGEDSIRNPMKCLMRKLIPLGVALLVLIACGWSSSSALGSASTTGDADVAAFYTGKTVRIIVGYPPGGGYDAYSRVIGRHLGRHIPG